MSDVTETELPGVGLRYEFETDRGERLGVLVHRTGRRDLLVYDEADPDACRSTVSLEEGEARTLADLLGTSRIAEHLGALRQEVEGLAFEWMTVEEGSAWAGLTLRDAEVHSSTGVSVVAILRDGTTIPAPHSTDRLLPGDVAVGVGTAAGLDEARARMVAA